MRPVIFIAGIILLVAGMLLYFPAQEKVDEFDSYGIFSDFGRMVDPDLDKEYNDAKNMVTFGIIMFVVGLLVTIAGIVTKKDEKI